MAENSLRASTSGHSIGARETVGMDFNFATAIKLPDLESDKMDKIQEFVDVASCYYDSLNQAGKTALIPFLIKAKIKSKARTRLGETDATTMSKLTNVLMQRVAASETYQQLQYSINGARQGRRSLENFAGHLDDLANRMALAKIREENVQDENIVAGIRQMAKAMATSQFMNYCHEEVKLVVKVARPKTLDEALAVASSSNLDTHQINHIRQNDRNRRGSNNYNNRSGNNHQRGGWSNYNQRGGNHNNNNQRGGYRNNNYNQRGGHSNNYNNNQRNNHRNNNGNNNNYHNNNYNNNNYQNGENRNNNNQRNGGNHRNNNNQRNNDYHDNNYNNGRTQVHNVNQEETDQATVNRIHHLN